MIRVRNWIVHSPLSWALPIQLVLLFWRLDLLEPWGDELYTLDTAPRSLQEIGSMVSQQIHPPLYFYFLHFWIQGPWPGSLLTKMRAMSAVWGLLATVLLYVLWLRKEDPRVQRTFLLLWTLSPSFLLYARMARSYTMQLTLALVAIYAALHWEKELSNWRRLLGYVFASAALLYTHYIPGLAILASTFCILLFRRRLSLRTRLWAAAGSTILVAVLYLPWLATMHSAFNSWVVASPGAYRVGGIVTDQIVRIGYWFVSFAFGETLSTASLLIGAALTPVIGYALWRALRSRPDWFTVVLMAAFISYIGAIRWTTFPFTPARVLFALPFFLIFCIRGIHAAFRRSSLILVCLAVLYVTAIYAYFSKTGYLNKGYCVPYEEMAAIIRSGSANQSATVVLDGYSSIPDPLLNRIPSQAQLILLDNEDSADAVRKVAKKQTVIWFWRHMHDTSPGEFVSRLEKEIEHGRHAVKYEFLPYSPPERWALWMLRGAGQPTHFYQLLEIR